MNINGILKPLRIVVFVLLISLLAFTSPLAARQSDRGAGPSLDSPASPSLHFNNDKIADLVVGIPNEDQTGKNSMGAFQVFYGASPGGLEDGFDDVWGPMASGAEANDEFGFSLATGDFDADRYVDLAVGIPYEDVIYSSHNISNAGAIEVWYGAAFGLDSGSTEYWHQDSPGVIGTPEGSDLFGYSLAAGDFDADGFVDLAVGVPHETVYEQHDGYLHIFYGSAAGLDDSDSFYQYDASLNQPEEPQGAILEPAEANDSFGYVLASGNFNGDSYTDLAIGVPNEDIESGSWADAGMVHILYGSDSGLTTTGWQSFVHPLPDDGMTFGFSLAAGDFSGDGYDDLAIGSPYYDSPGIADAGSVRVLFGTSSGLTSSGAQNWKREFPQDYGQFGWSLSSGDYNNNGYDDLAVGIPYEDVAGMETYVDAGAVEIFYGDGAEGLIRRTDHADTWHQGRSGMQDTYEHNDWFGYALASGDFNHDSIDDLAISVAREDIFALGNNEGAVHVMYGSLSGITASGNWFFYQGMGSLEGSADVDDYFGIALAASWTNSWLFLPVISK